VVTVDGAATFNALATFDQADGTSRIAVKGSLTNNPVNGLTQDPVISFVNGSGDAVGDIGWPTSANLRLHNVVHSGHITLRVYDSSGADYIELVETGSAAQIKANANVIEFWPSASSEAILTIADDHLFMDANTGDKLSLLSNRIDATNMYGFGVEASALYSKSATYHRWYIATNADTTSYEMQLDASNLDLRNGIGLRIYNSDNLDVGRIRHDGTDVLFTGVNTANWNFGSANRLACTGGTDLRVYDATDADYLDISLDGADANVACSGVGVLKLTGQTAGVQMDGYVAITDGITAPSAITGYAALYVDSADGDLKIIFADGTVKTIVVDT
jgi:hypothetical protein